MSAPCAEIPQDDLLFRILQFPLVASPEFFPSRRIMTEPFAQFRGRTEILDASLGGMSSFFTRVLARPIDRGA